MKKVLLIVIDALATRVVKPALARGDLPNFAKLVEAGRMHEQCTSIFPSITPAATASIITGCYPRRHGIAGAFWYERDRSKVAYYGDDFWVIVNKGVGGFFHDFLIDLNDKRLRADTLFEHVERDGGQACVLNYMWFRSGVPHDVNAPLLLELLPNVSLSKQIRGPAICALADFVRSTHPHTGEPLSATGGVMRRFGFHDKTTADYLLQLADSGPLPDLTVAYFPNNDFESHSVGPESALPVLTRIDGYLGELCELRGGIERLLSEAAILITGDHSQSDTEPEPAQRDINLTEVLSNFQLADAGTDWGRDDEIMACPNMRAAEIYFRSPTAGETRESVIDRLLEDRQVDQVCWAIADDHLPGGRRFYVATSDRGRLMFHRIRDESAQAATDEYGNEWMLEGELDVVDARQNTRGQVEFGQYPNALERIAESFSDVSGDLIATARLGREFRVDESQTHPGGSHGSLHRLDSTAPLIVAGVPQDVELETTPRIVDVAPFSLDILGRHDTAAELRKNLSGCA